MPKSKSKSVEVTSPGWRVKDGAGLSLRLSGSGSKWSWKLRQGTKAHSILIASGGASTEAEANRLATATLKRAVKEYPDIQEDGGFTYLKAPKVPKIGRG